jgi:F0F1-type ATP synthase membrane subunit b/b'/gas vesicle protein
VTIQQFQQETLGELNNFASSLQSTLHDFQRDTTNVLQETGVSITKAVETSITGMESQREAFQESAEQAANTFKGIREDLEQSLKTQSDQQKEILQVVYSRFLQILNKANENFTTQTQTLETVGKEASQLMNNAKENLEQTLTNIDDTLQNTRVTVQEELQTFRIEYQNSLTQFFNEQNQLLEGTLGTQRNALQEVVDNLRDAFAEETQRRQSLMNDLTNTINEVTRGMNEIDQVTNTMQTRVREI